MIYKYLIILGLVLGIGGAGYWYFTWSQDRIEILAKENTSLNTTVSSLETELETVRSNVEQARRQRVELARQIEIAEDYQRELIGKLQRHDLTRLALAKPGLIQTRINDATFQIFRDLESITTRPDNTDFVRDPD